MSLNELRAQVEGTEEDVAEVDEPELQDEPLDEGSSEDEGTETEEATESEDFELELDGESEPDQQKPSAEAALIHKLTKQRHKRKEAEDEVAELRRKLEQYESGQSAPQQRQQAAPAVELPQFPDMYDEGIEGDRAKYDKAVKAWFAASKEAEQAQSRQSQQTDQYRQQLEEKSTNLAKRAAKFMQENKIKPERVISAIERATSEIDSVTKVDGALAHLLDSVGDGSERVAYYIGTNETAMSKIKEALAKDPNGLSTISLMTRMAEKLKPKHSTKTSKAPSPDEPLRGDGSPVTARRLQEKYDKASTPSELFKLRQEAKKAGVELT